MLDLEIYEDEYIFLRELILEEVNFAFAEAFGNEVPEMVGYTISNRGGEK